MFSSNNKEKNNLLSLAKEIIVDSHPDCFIGDGMVITDRSVGFRADKKFTEVLEELAKAPVYQQMAWRVHTLVWACQSVMHLEGDFVECGVFRGFKSHFLCRYFDFETLSRSFWLFDTYEGIAPQYSDGSPIDKNEHAKPNLHQFVEQRFSTYQNVNVVKGTVPDVFSDACPEKVAFLHLDMNSYQAEIGALEQLWSRMPVGAVVVLDDYGFKDFYAQKHNEDRWFSERGQHILELPTGQGVVVKR